MPMGKRSFMALDDDGRGEQTRANRHHLVSQKYKDFTPFRSRAQQALRVLNVYNCTIWCWCNSISMTTSLVVFGLWSPIFEFELWRLIFKGLKSRLML